MGDSALALLHLVPLRLVLVALAAGLVTRLSIAAVEAAAEQCVDCDQRLSLLVVSRQLQNWKSAGTRGSSVETRW